VKFFQRTFKTDRFKTLDTVDEKALHWIKNLDKDSTYFILDNGYAYVRGRYMWTTKGRRPVSFHGGISLTEVLTPLLIVSK